MSNRRRTSLRWQMSIRCRFPDQFRVAMNPFLCFCPCRCVGTTLSHWTLRLTVPTASDHVTTILESQVVRPSAHSAVAPGPCAPARSRAEALRCSAADTESGRGDRTVADCVRDVPRQFSDRLSEMTADNRLTLHFLVDRSCRSCTSRPADRPASMTKPAGQDASPSPGAQGCCARHCDT